MRDCEDTNSFREFLISPRKRRRKQKSKKGEKFPKRKNEVTTKAEEQTQNKKKKKMSKFKEAMKAKKEKKKEKNRLAFEVEGHSGVFTQSSNAQPEPPVQPETSNPLNRDSRKKSKRKTKVMFDVSPGYICAKHPKCVSSSQQSPKESTVLENQSVSCSQAVATGQSQSPTHKNDSQCNSEDINSQDLFITQKTFRAPSLPSSDEASDNGIKTTPAVAEIQEHHKELLKCPQGRETEHVQKQKTKEEKKERLIKREPLPFYGINLYLDEPIVITSSPECKKPSSSKQSPPCLQQSLFPLMSLITTSTQTENFFTTEVCSYFNFCRKRRDTQVEVLEPLDLSLDQRARKDLRTCLSEKTSSVQGGVRGVNSKHMYAEHVEVQIKKKCNGGDSCPERAQRHNEAAVSSQLEYKSADTTSSEDSEHPSRTGKLDLAQVRAVQMRLNESFFFKPKGEGQSPRPESPLMKLTLSNKEVKSRKGR